MAPNINEEVQTLTMANLDTDKTTAITFLIEGDNHKEVANKLMIQFTDGGWDQEIEGRLENIGITMDDSDFNINSNLIILKVSGDC